MTSSTTLEAKAAPAPNAAPSGPPGFAFKRDILLADVSRREAETHAAIERHGQNAAQLRTKANEYATWQQTNDAQHALRQAAEEVRAADACRLTLRHLVEERDAIVRGSDPRLALALTEGRTLALGAQQAEYAAATAAFDALPMTQAATAARRLVDAAAAMGHQPPPMALAIAQYA